MKHNQMRMKTFIIILTSIAFTFLMYYALCKNTEGRFDKIIYQNPHISKEDFLNKMGKANFIISGDTCLPGQTCYEYYGFLEKKEICFDSTGDLKNFGYGVRNRLFEWFGYSKGMVTICAEFNEKLPFGKLKQNTIHQNSNNNRIKQDTHINSE